MQSLLRSKISEGAILRLSIGNFAILVDAGADRARPLMLHAIGADLDEALSLFY